MTKYAVLGAGGMLGQEFVGLLPKDDCLALSSDQCDVTNLDSLNSALDKIDVVINCAAWTAVDEAETNENAAYAVNAIGAGNVAKVCERNGATLIHFSTDYIFSGDSKIPYNEGDSPDPKSAYGRTKLAGEQEVLKWHQKSSYIIRTAWLYGEHGSNFVKTIVQLEKKLDVIKVVNDQVGQPTWSLELAKKSLELINVNATNGIYHGTSSGETTWFNFAQEIFKELGADPSRIEPISSSEFVRPAKRPHYSVLAHENWMKSGLKEMRDWQESFREAFRAEIFTDA